MPRSSQHVDRVGDATVRTLLDGQHIDWHQHATDQLVYPARGVLSVLTGDTSWVVPSPGRGIYIPTRTPHAHRASGLTSVRTVLLPAGTQPYRAPQVVNVSALLRELLVALARQPPPPGRRRERMLAVIVDELADAAQPALALPQPTDPRLVAASTALRSEPAGVSAAELAGVAGVSQRTLSRLVREQLGMTVPQWRTLHRLTASLVLLTDGTGVTGTAQRCGWHSTSAYIAAFRVVFGRTPGSYQRSLCRETTR